MKKGFTESGIYKIISNKFVIASVLFLTWIIFFDENSIVEHVESKQQLNDLVQQKAYYKERIASDKQKLEDLSLGKEELEKFAREQYLMSKPGEDVFIVIEEEK
ncbi:septum formation initiator family protein [Prolixibacteraceae bacterium Z1-6]|uniref:Septum formation initiator family protein n=1 Tax=Draconibacterium aestuarii TaxID=2998507 RepID=A0A9X3FB19_9BACT|nr:septum formation initiator family protein [Prolixibacteraceae bacterium Z1-6]